MRPALRQRLRGHIHCLVIVPLVVIAMTWPTFLRVFESDGFWLHSGHVDNWSSIWDSWHVGRVLAGRADLYYSDTMFHPRGVSLAFQHISFPHALLMVLFGKFMPVDSAYNLLFILILCFNAYCAYILILHLLKEKWSALYGALVFGISLPFHDGSTTPDLIVIGTIPLTIYFFHRAALERRMTFAALAGFCAGATAFIAVYAFVFIVISIGIIAVFLAVSRWRSPAFWRGLLLFVVVCAAISSLRFYPMFLDAAILGEGLQTHLGKARSNDLLECCVVSGSPLTGELFRQALAISQDPAKSALRLGENVAYLGYGNLFLMLCAILHKPLRRRLAPWLAVLICYFILRLGHFLTLNGVEYRSFLLPEHFLTEWFPPLFGNIYVQEFYQYGALAPLAILASFGLARLIGTKPTRARASVFLLFALLLAIEFYKPLTAKEIKRERIAYIDWLSTETDRPIKLIDMPRSIRNELFFLFYQTIHEYPLAFGYSHRNLTSAKTYILGNPLLREWDGNNSVHCLPRDQGAFLSALERLLADGFTHVVVHKWMSGKHFSNHSFWSALPAYDNNYVAVYRLSQLRKSCDTTLIEPPRIRGFAESPLAIPGARTSILSIHPSERIDDDLLDYLGSLFSDWRSLIHIYQERDELLMQSAGASYADLDAFTNDNQVLNVVYNGRDADPDLLKSHAALGEFNLCQRDLSGDGAVIETYVNRDFSCELVTALNRLKAGFDNGARLENALVDILPEQVEVQLMWSDLPGEAHSVSLQLFDPAGAKAIGQDVMIGDASLYRLRLDVSSLDPGRYEVNLIMYNYQSGNSVGGTADKNGGVAL